MKTLTELPQAIDALILEFRAAGVLLLEEKGELKVWGPSHALQDGPLLQKLKTHKRDLVSHFSKRRGQGALTDALSVDPQNKHEPFPLTEIQRAYWVGRQQAFDQGDVSIHYYTEVDGKDLDFARLQRAWNLTVQQHDMLRAVVNQEAMQRILPDVPDYEIGFTNLCKLNKADRDRCLDDHRNTMSQTVHSTEDWPGFALHLFQLTKHKFRLTYSQDLIHIDGGSLLNVVDTFSRFYADETAKCAPFDMSFRDYVFYEIALKETAKYQNHLEFWTQTVKDLPAPPALPVNAARAKTTTFVRRDFELDTADFKRIKTQSERLKITPTAYIMTLFSEVVSAWNGAEDYALNVTVFNRQNIHKQIHKIAGDFTSMMPIAIRTSSGNTVGDRANALQKILWDQMEHKDVSGITVLDLLRKAKGEHGAANLSVVFTSLLNLSNQGFNPALFEGIGKQSFVLTQTPQVTLDHQIFETVNGGIGFSWDVIEEQFPAGMIDDMFAAYKTLLKACLADEARWHKPHIGTLLPTHFALISDANDTVVDFGTDATLRDLFYEQVGAHAHAPALVTSCVEFNFAEVARLAEQLAHQLVQHGVGAGARVAVWMEKGWQQPIAAMAIHICGGSYVPIDPTAPQDRLNFIIDDASIQVLLGDETTLPELGELSIPSLLVDDKLLAAAPRAAPVDLQTSAESHLIYTSGSTGKPKGVMIEHRNVVNRVLDINGRFNIGRGDGILGLTALHHDLSVYDIFGVWAAGAKLVLPDFEDRLNPAHWCDLMRRHNVTLWNSVPAFASILSDHLEMVPADLSGVQLRWMILAGDWIPVTLPNRVHSLWPSLQFIASGGPTETTIWDIWNEVEMVDPNASSVIYGKPLANASYHILDAAQQPCPIWVPGELYIAGAGVTRGYLNRPELNAEKYLALEGHTSKLFRSGDLGRYLPDGSIEFLGRNDFQVKVNGQRIELGEIEAATTAVPGVAEAVAVVQTRDTDQEVVLFVVGADRADNKIDLAAQAQAFKDRGVTIFDPSERLEGKLAYDALSPATDAKLIELPATDQPKDLARSQRDYDQSKMSLQTFARFFEPLQGWLDPVNAEAKMQYGSAGGLYPVQVYFYLKPDRVDGLSAGVYRYFPLAHAFELVAECTIPSDVHWGYNFAMGDGAPFWVYLIADYELIRAQYGDLAEPMAHIEAGLITQKLREAGGQTGFGICSCGDIGFDSFRDKFELGSHQELLTTMTAGISIDPEIRASQTDIGDTVRTALSATLPKHMMPLRITKLAELPLTGNAKVDRKRLMSMAQPNDTPRVCIAPSSTFETVVVDVLAKLLDRETISVTDNFFEIGANSALLVKAYRMISDATGEKFQLIEMFRFPTVRNLAQNVSAPTSAPRSSKASARAEKQKAILKRRRLKIKDNS